MRSMVAGLAVAMTGAALQAQAQDPRIVVRAPIAEQVIREIRRDVSDATRNIGQRGRDNNFPAEQTRRETRTIAIGPTGSLDLRGVSGAMTITAGNVKEVTMDIERVARGRTDDDARRGLDEVTVEIDHRGERAVVETRQPRRNDLPYRVNVAYTVTVPAGTQVTIANMSGAVTVTGVKGDVSIDIMSGAVKIANSARVVKAKTMSGEISLTDIESPLNLDVVTFSGPIWIERAKARRLVVDAMSGNITGRDISADDVALKTLSGFVEYSGALNSSGRYEFRAHSGEVRVIVVGNTGFELDASTFSGSVRPAAEFGLKTTSSNRREVRGTVGSGGARVVASTLSGDVIVIRK